jgi:hypothetical protein
VSYPYKTTGKQNHCELNSIKPSLNSAGFYDLGKCSFDLLAKILGFRYIFKGSVSCLEQRERNRCSEQATGWSPEESWFDSQQG